MRTAPESWVEATLHAGGLSPVPDDRAVFQAALGGLLVSSELSLVQLGEIEPLVGVLGDGAFARAAEVLAQESPPLRRYLRRAVENENSAEQGHVPSGRTGRDGRGNSSPE